MKIFFHNDTLVKKDAAKVPSSIKVCMHVLGKACTDMRVMRTATALVEAGFAVSIVDIECESNKPVEEDISGVRVTHVITPNWYTSRSFKPWFLIQAVQLFIRSTLRLIRAPADIYHAHDTTALPACYLAALLRQKPLIYDAHELPLSDEMNTTRWRGLITLSSRLLSIIVPHCAGVITVSPPIAQEMRNRYHYPDISLVRNVPPYQAVPRSDLLWQHFGLSPDIRIALYQGGFYANRGLDRLIRAAAFLERDNMIVLMGPDSEGIRPQLEGLIASEGVTDRVKIMPAVSYAELLNWTASADIGLIIYTPEHSLNVQMCLPNKLFEYLMVGLPILASPLDAVSDITRTYDVGQIVTSLTPADVGGAINAMLADNAALARMRRNALDAAQYEFNWEKEKQQLIRLYHEIQSRTPVKNRKCYC